MNQKSENPGKVHIYSDPHITYSQVSVSKVCIPLSFFFSQEKLNSQTQKELFL